jgi:hypothetical protein
MRVVKSKHEHHNRQSHSTLEAGATQSDDAMWRGRSKLVGDDETLRALFSDRSMWFMGGERHQDNTGRVRVWSVSSSRIRFVGPVHLHSTATPQGQ